MPSCVLMLHVYGYLLSWKHTRVYNVCVHEHHAFVTPQDRGSTQPANTEAGRACRLALEAQHFYQLESERQLVKYNEATVFALLLVRAASPEDAGFVGLGGRPCVDVWGKPDGELTWSSG